MYNYKFDNRDGNFSIKTGFVKNMNEVEVEIIEQTADYIHSISTYPNGWKVEVKQTANVMEIKSNIPIVVDEDGTLRFDDSSLHEQKS